MLAGPEVGRSHTENLSGFVPNTADARQKRSNNRFLLFASRLGLYDTSGGKYRRVKPKGEHEFSTSVGTEVIIEIGHQPKKDNPSVVYANITFGGVYTLTDPKHKDVKRAAAGDKPAAVAVPAGPDLSDI